MKNEFVELRAPSCGTVQLYWQVEGDNGNGREDIGFLNEGALFKISFLKWSESGAHVHMIKRLSHLSFFKGSIRLTPCALLWNG